nr:hypothetical protein [Rubrivivax sp.]
MTAIEAAGRGRWWVGFVAAALLAGCGGSVCIDGVPCGPVPNFAETRPVAVQTSRPFASIALGNGHSCMLDVDGAAWCWGSNDRGQLGAVSTDRCVDGNVDCSSVPLAVTGGRRFVTLAASQNHTCALDSTGAACCWGGGPQLGSPDRADSTLPVAVAGG